MKGSRQIWTGVLALGCALAVAVSAGAAQTNFEDIDLEANGGDTVFQYGFDLGCVDGQSGSEGFIYSVEDAAQGAGEDALNGALPLYVDGEPFTQPTGTADQIGSATVRSSTRTLAGLKVSRVGHSFVGSPTLRELVKFVNPGKRTKKVPVTFATEFGSGSETAVLASSSGDLDFTRKDRWGITGDDTITLSRPAVTLVNYGKGKVLRPYEQLGPIGSPDDGGIFGVSCAIDSFFLKLGPKQTGYLMFFVEVNSTISGAKTAATKFNAKKPMQLLQGMSKAAKAKTLNWDLK